MSIQCARHSSRCDQGLFRTSAWIIALFAAPAALAQGWQQVIHLNGKRGSAVGGGAGNTVYAGLGTGEVFRSDDNGVTWTRSDLGLVDDAGRMLLPKAFLVTPSGRVIRGGDNASWQNKVGSPVFVSDNRGANWNEVPLPFASTARNPAGIGISDLVLHQGAVYFSDLLSEGVWKSTDNGTTWTAVGTDLPTAPFVGFAKTYYALASAGGALLTVEGIRGVFRSTDGGVTWAQSVKGIPGVANSPLVGGRTWSGNDVVGAADGTAFAIVDSRVYRSRDAGVSWEEVGAGLFMSPNPFAPSVIQPSARKVELMGDRVFVTSTDGNPRYFEGTALGESWSELPRIPVGGEPASILAQSFAAHNGALYAAGTNGIHRLDLADAVRTPLLPIVETQPAGPFGLNIGSTLQVRATARGTAPFTFEWRIADQLVAGQTGATLRFTATAASAGGTLSLVVRNAAGSVTNVLGQLNVAPTAPGVIDYGFPPQNPGGAGVSAIGFGPDGSVYYAGGFSSQFETFTGLRKAHADGTIDSSFVTGALIGVGSGPGATSGTPTFVFPLDDGSVLVGAAGTSNGARYYRRLLPDGAVDASWPWPAEMAGGPRKIVRLADGRLLVGGGSAGGIHRLHGDGTLDLTFHGPSSIGRFQQNYVSDLAVLADGRILIAGLFNEVDGVARVGLARLLPSGALDRSWVPAALPSGSEVKALVVLPDGKILIGGSFPTVGGQPHRNLARLDPDGSVDAAVGDLIPNTVPAGVVNAIVAQPDGRAWVGGAFRGVSGRDSLFRLKPDGSVDTDFPELPLRERGGTQSMPVLTLAWTADGRLWIGMAGQEAGGHAAGQLFRLRTDVEGPSVGYAGPDQTPDEGTSIVLRGAVSGAYSAVQWRFEGVPMAGATSLELPLSNVIQARSGRYDLVVTSPGGEHVSEPATVRVRGPVVIDQAPAAAVGLVGGTAGLAVGAFGQLPLTYQWTFNGGNVAGATNRALSLTNLSLSAAGDYAVRVTGRNGSTLTSDPAYLTVIPPPGTTNSAFRLGLFPSASFTAFRDLEFLPDGRVLVGGSFATRAGGPNAHLTRLTADGAIDSSFQFEATGVTEFAAMDLQPDGRVVVLLRTGSSYAVRRLLESGAVDPAFTEQPVDSGTELEIAPDGGILVLGASGVIRLESTGALDAGFRQRMGLNGPVQSLSVDPAGRLYVAGSFDAAGGLPRTPLARLWPDGTRDASFAPTNTFASPGTVRALANGALVSDFNGFHRFDEDGRRDEAFGWRSRFAAWDLLAAGGVAGVLPSPGGEGVLRAADGSPALPISAMKVPASFNGYSFLRVAPDGAIWLALGASGSPVGPASMLFKLYGTVTPLALVTAPVSQTVDLGARVAFHAVATGTSRVGYQWRRNGVPLAGETNATLVLAAAKSADRGDYTVLVSNRSGTLESRPATLLVLGLPEILAVRGGGTLGLADPLGLSVSARGAGAITFQWRHKGSPIAGATNATYIVRAATLADGGDYDVVIANALGSVASDPIRVAVEVRPGAVIGSLTGVSSGGGMELNMLPNGDFLVDGRAYNRFGELQFALPFPDGTSTVLRDRIAVDAARGRIYAGPTRRVRAYTLDGALVPGYAGPSANVRRVRVEAAGTILQSTEGLSFPFQRLDAVGAVDAAFVPAVRPSLDAWPLSDGTILSLTFAQRTVSGRIVYQTLLDRLLPGGGVDAAFRRSTNVFSAGGQANRLFVDRENRILVLGGNGTAETNRLVRLNSDGSVDDSFVPPAFNGEVTAVAQQRNGRLVVVGAFTRVDGQARSLIARLNADGSHDTSFQPGAGFTTPSGQNIAFDVDLLPTGEIVVTGTFNAADGLPRHGVALISGDSLDLYFLREPGDLVLGLGASAELIAEGTGTSAVSYQWFKDGVRIPGQSGARLRVGPAEAASVGDYRVVIRNASGELSSRVARVDVVLPPGIRQQPLSQIADSGGAATFSVEAAGLRLGYQWHFEGAPIPNATNAAVRIDPAMASWAGAYSVVVSNSAGQVTSTVAQLRVRPAPAPVGGIPLAGIVGEMLFAGNFLERSNRFVTISKGTPTLVEGFDGGQAARLRSGSDWLQLGTGTARLGGVAYSASFWIWPEERGSLNVYSLTLSLSGVGREHYLYLGGDDTAVSGQRIFLATRGLTSVHSSDDRAYVPNLMGRWTHVAVTYRGGGPSLAANFKVYLDGEEVPLVNSSNPIAGTGAGNGLGTHGPAAAFRLDDFRLYNRALAPEEVARLQRPGPGAASPVITRQPSGGSVAAGESFSFTVEAVADGLFYEWYRGATLLPDADGPTLAVRRASAVDAGEYRVVVSNAGGSTNSATATLAIATGANPFAEWAAAAGLADDRALPGADADGDGVPNAAEFMHGSSPVEAKDRPQYKLVLIEVNGAPQPAVEFTRRMSGGPTRLTVQTADNVAFRGATDGEEVSATPRGEAFEQVVLRASQPLAPRQSVFFRFVVESP